MTILSDPPSVKAVILVGGPSRGTRFRPLSLHCPKPLFPIAGQPLFLHHIHALAQLPSLQDIYLIGFFEESVFAPHLEAIQREYPRLRVRYLREYQALGTAGGLYHFRDELLKTQAPFLFVLHADVCVQADLQRLLAFHIRQRSVFPELLGTLFSTQVSPSTTHRYGCMVIQPAVHEPGWVGGEVLHYVEKPDFQVSQTINGGLYVFERSIFKYLEQMKAEATVPADLDERKFSKSMESILVGPEPALWFEHDVFKQLAGTKRLCALMDTEAMWMPLKNATSVVLANTLMLQVLEQSRPNLLTQPKKEGPCIVGPVHIHPSAEVHPTAKIGPNVSIGPRVVIHSGVRLRDSVVLDGTTVHSNACILSSVLGWNSVVGKWTRVEGTPTTLAKGEEEVTLMKNGHKTDTATVLGHDVTLANEIIVRNCIVLPHKTLGSSHQNDILM